MDRLDEIRNWLAADFNGSGADSVIVAWCFERGCESFRVRVKRLLREALLDTRRRGRLLAYLLNELIDGQRLTGRRRDGRWRFEPMAGRPELEPLLELGRRHVRRHAPTQREILAAAQEALQDNPAAAQDLAWKDVEALACALLAADCVPDRRNSLEAALELCEDALWPRGTAPWLQEGSDPRGRLMGDEFARLFDKVAASTRDATLRAARSRVQEGDAAGAYRALRTLAVTQVDQQELHNMGFRKGGTGEGHRRKATIDPYLLIRYFETRRQQKDDDGMWEDLLELYLATYQDERCRKLLVPATIDARTGIGVYLMGVERFGLYVREPDCGPRNVTVALVDHRLAEPANRSFLAQERGRNRGRAVMVLYPAVFPFDRALGGADRLRRERVRSLIEELRAQYDLRVHRSLERSFRSAQGIDHAPEGCPERFLPFFVP